MKFKRSKYLSPFFLISFFVSFSINTCISANAYSEQLVNSHPKDRLHLSEKIATSGVEDIIFEENENENELEFGSALVFISYLIAFINFESIANYFLSLRINIPKAAKPIYIAVCNFRI